MADIMVPSYCDLNTIDSFNSSTDQSSNESKTCEWLLENNATQTLCNYDSYFGEYVCSVREASMVSQPASSITIDGSSVTEVTIDGNVVFSKNLVSPAIVKGTTGTTSQSFDFENWNNVSVDIYAELNDSTPDATVLSGVASGGGVASHTFTGLQSSTQYTVYAQAKDPNNNLNDSPVASSTFTTDAPSYEWAYIGQDSSEPSTDILFTHQGSESADISYLESNYPADNHVGQNARTDDGVAWSIYEVQQI